MSKTKTELMRLENEKEIAKTYEDCKFYKDAYKTAMIGWKKSLKWWRITLAIWFIFIIIQLLILIFN